MLADRSALPVSSVVARSAGPVDRDASVPRRIAVAIAGRSCRAGLTEPPGRVHGVAHAPRTQHRIGFGRRPQASHVGVGETQQRAARGLGVDHRAAEEIGDAPGTASSAAAISPPVEDF